MAPDPVAAATSMGSEAAGPDAASSDAASSDAASDVSFAGASSSGTRRATMLEVLEPWRATVAAGMASKTVLVKANLVGLASGAEASAQVLPVTHVDALRGLLDFLRSISPSVPIVIADCSATPAIASMWKTAGYTTLTTEYPGVTLLDLGHPSQMPTVDQTIWEPDLSATTTIPISSAFADPKYYVISICRPKTHDTVVMTATSKNILMAAPLRSVKVDGARVYPKFLMHGRGSTTSLEEEAKCLSYNLFQLANVIYPAGAPALCVLDAWEGMEGNGPVNGSSVLQYCAVAGTDSLAVDRLSAVLMGFSDTATDPADPAKPSYTDLRYLKWISDAGFGNYDLDKINFVLGSLAELQGHATTYAMHSRYESETGWTGGPPDVLGTTTKQDASYLDPRPFLLPQPRGPVNPEDASVTFSLPIETGVRLSILTAQGAEVRQLASDFLSPGRYSVSWDGRDSHGSRVPAGSYVVRLGFGSRSAEEQERSLEDRMLLG
ncbi:MAG: DUF362 domain-containing protein [Micromonosporaceae bacterium]|nr:DUF362 domain-containing protein [Micromonosporaceae bacterium]